MLIKTTHHKDFLQQPDIELKRRREAMANYGHMLMRCVWQDETRMFEVPIHEDLESFAVSV